MKRVTLFFLACALIAPIPGCGPRRLRTDFKGYENTYAETSNRELLLNLARLENREPTYFFKIGTIQSTYKMAAALPTTASYALQGTMPGGAAPTGGGSPNISYENDPIFTFIPVNDETNAQFLLQQIPPETFYILYEQGWRIDQLFRLLVDRIELTMAPDSKTCEVVIYKNLPPPVETISTSTNQADKDALYKNYQQSLSQYATFLRISAILYSLQKHGDLVLSGTNTFVPFDENSKIGNDDPQNNSASASAAPAPPAGSAPQANPGKNGQLERPQTTSPSPNPGDMINAWNKNAVWEKQGNGWVLGQMRFNPVFYLNHYSVSTSACDDMPASSGSSSDTPKPDIGRIECDIHSDQDLTNLIALQGGGQLVLEILNGLKNGFSISDSSNTKNATIGPCSGDATGTSSLKSHLVMRSLLGVMAAAAQEQKPFQALLKNDPIVPAGVNLHPTSGDMTTQSKYNFAKLVPQIEQKPLLELTSPPGSEALAPVASVDYRGTNYHIADLKSDSGSENQYWNRDVFRLIDQLTSQVTVDISKFPLTTILQ